MEIFDAEDIKPRVFYVCVQRIKSNLKQNVSIERNMMKLVIPETR